MPYKAKGKCVYKKDTGAKVGCTKGPVKKYLAALHTNVKGESNKITLSRKDAAASIRKPMPQPTTAFKNKKKYSRKEFKNFKDFYEQEMSTLGSVSRNVGDFSHVAETTYADGQDETVPSVQSSVDEKQTSKNKKNKTKKIKEDESVPASSLPMGSTTASTAAISESATLEDIYTTILNKVD